MEKPSILRIQRALSSSALGFEKLAAAIHHGEDLEEITRCGIATCERLKAILLQFDLNEMLPNRIEILEQKP